MEATHSGKEINKLEHMFDPTFNMRFGTAYSDATRIRRRIRVAWALTNYQLQPEVLPQPSQT